MTRAFLATALRRTWSAGPFVSALGLLVGFAGVSSLGQLPGAPPAPNTLERYSQATGSVQDIVRTVAGGATGSAATAGAGVGESAWMPVRLDPAAVPLFLSGRKGPRADRYWVEPQPEVPAPRPVEVMLAGLTDGSGTVGGADLAAGAGGPPGVPLSSRERRCLATAVYFEARGEPIAGQIAVAQTILNRVRSRFYPDSICAVVHQPGEDGSGCQYSFSCDGLSDVPRPGTHWEMALEIADRAIRGEASSAGIGAATHYHAVAVRPDWTAHMERVTRIGRHVFYRAPTLGGSVPAVPDGGSGPPGG